MDPANNNSWRTLARALGQPHTTDIVRIPDLQGPLFDEVRYTYDQESFRTWFEEHFAGRLVDPRDAYPEWRFNHQAEPDGQSGFTEAGRNSFLCVYAKLKHEGLWSEVKSVRWVGETGEMTFLPERGSARLQQWLLTREYGDWWLASKGSPWGVRSRFQGAQLHFRGYNNLTEPDNAHIDLNNPGDPPGGPPSSAGAELPGAIMHFIEDLHFRRESHEWHKLRAALQAQGIWLPPVVL